jgi:hypothetical protein
MRAARRLISAENGQSAVEFVLMFPFIMLMILVIAEAGLMLGAYVTVNNAAAEATRYASVANLPGTCNTDPDFPSVEGRAVNMSTGRISCAEVTVLYNKIVPGTEFVRGDGVSVHIAHTYDMVTPLSDLAAAFSFGTIPTTFIMSACSEARLEARPTDQSVLVAGAGCE